MAIFYGIKNDHIDIVKYLLSLPKTNIEIKNNGLTPFLFSILCDNETIVKAFIDYTNVDVNFYPLTFACDFNCNNSARALLELETLDINSTHGSRWSPLSISLGSLNHELTEMLLSRTDIDINKTSIDGKCPLAIAFFRNNLRGADLLLSRPEINLTICDENGNSIEYYAQNCENNQIAMKMIEETKLRQWNEFFPVA